MKNTSLKFLAALAIVLFSLNVFAEGKVTVESIPSAMQARAQTLHSNVKNFTTFANSTIGYDTYIMVINYTDSTINVSFPAGPLTLTRLTSARYERSNYTGFTPVILANAYGVPFWQGNVQYHDIISVYVSGGQYVVYDTH